MKNRNEFMEERRAYDRTPCRTVVKFFYGNSIYFGTVADFSGDGMLIKTKKMFIPMYSHFEIVINSNHDELKLDVRINRIDKSTDNHYMMGVELMGRPDNYFRFMTNTLNRSE